MSKLCVLLYVFQAEIDTRSSDLYKLMKTGEKMIRQGHYAKEEVRSALSWETSLSFSLSHTHTTSTVTSFRSSTCLQYILPQRHTSSLTYFTHRLYDLVSYPYHWYHPLVGLYTYIHTMTACMVPADPWTDPRPPGRGAALERGMGATQGLPRSHLRIPGVLEGGEDGWWDQQCSWGTYIHSVEGEWLKGRELKRNRRLLMYRKWYWVGLGFGECARKSGLV